MPIVTDQLLTVCASMQKPLQCNTRVPIPNFVTFIEAEFLHARRQRFSANDGVRDVQIKASKTRQPQRQVPPEKCAAKERAKLPKPPRAVSPPLATLVPGEEGWLVVDSPE